ncbi:MAG TPA: sugar ABC transporter substrate-binding protein [Firmicutes bacterium]|nr:sugar ABC transporter substrate-binding protein [Bacillota bacterium]
MRKRILAVAAAALLLLSLSAGVLAADPVTIRFYYRSGGTRPDVVRAWIAEFEAQNPDIHVEWEVAASGWQDKLVVAMAAETAPDVVEFWGNFAQQLARKGMLLDLRPYVARDFTEEDISDFFPASWQNVFVQYGEYKGEQYGLPRYINTMANYYNKTMLDNAGLESPRSLAQRGLWNWNTLEQMARKLTRRVDGQVVQRGFMTMTRGWDRMAQWLWEAGGDWFDPNNPTRFIGDQPEAMAALNFLHRNIWEDQIFLKDLDWNAFYNSQVAMTDDGLQVIFNNYDNAIQGKFDWDLTVRAEGPNGRKPWATDDALGIWRGSKHPEEAWRFLKFITSKQGQEIMIRYEGLPPVRRSAASAYLKLDSRFNLAAFVESMAYAQVGITNRVAGDVAAIGTEINNALRSSLVNNQVPPSTAMENVKRVVEAIMRETAQ